MKKILIFIISIMILSGLALPGLALPTLAVNKPELDAAVAGAAAYMLKTVRNPQVDAVGGEWAVIGLARSGFDVPDSYYQSYYKTVEQYVKEKGGVLHDKKYTEYSRVILALTAAGFDPRDVAGYDLTAPLGDFERTVWQGINGPIFALIALDTLNYPIPANSSAQTQATRDMYVAEILRRQLNDGGWRLADGATESTKNKPCDPDITGMALQALAKYQHKPDVKAATAKALERLSAIQGTNGGYEGWGGVNIESTIQVLVALCELDISVDDPRFIKNGNTLIDNILLYKNADGSFNHTYDGDGNSQLSSEQALYALVAAARAAESKNSLYRMSDVIPRGDFTPPPSSPGPGLPGKHADVQVMPVIYSGRTFADIRNHVNQTAIEALAARGIINGKTETVFDPDATMTRAEFAAIITRGLGLISNTELRTANSEVQTPNSALRTPSSEVQTPNSELRVSDSELHFSDVAKSAWYSDYVNVAAYYWIVNGLGNGTFNPNGTITRQEAAVMVARAAKLAGMDTARDDAEIRDTLAMFGDYRTVASWAMESMTFCFDSSIADDAGFDIEPGRTIQRCEIVEMLYRMLSAANLQNN